MAMSRFREALRMCVAPGYLSWASRLNGGGDPKGDQPDPPNYQPVADASSEAANLSYKLGQDQLAENQRQYDLNRAALEPIVKAQTDLALQAKTQGDELYARAKSNQFPLEDKLQAEAMAAGSDQRQEEAAGRAVADVRQGTTSATNSAIREGLRYGYSPARIAAIVGANASKTGLAEATAANSARIQERDTGYAKKMDVAGLYRGLAGASTGAYSVASGAGTSAGQTQVLPSQILASGNAQGIGTIMGGQNMKLTGLGNVLNAQTNYATGGGQNWMSGLGSLLGGGAALYSAYNSSDRRLKEDIEQVGVDEDTGLSLYEFRYAGGDGSKYRGVMSDEVKQVFPDAVKVDEDGFEMVDYSKIGIKLELVDG